MKIKIQIVRLLCLAIYGLSILHGWVPHTHHQHNELATHSEVDHHHHHDGGHDHEESKDKKGLKSLVVGLFHQHSHAPELAFEQDNFHKPGQAPGRTHPSVFESLKQYSLSHYVESEAFNELDFWKEKIHFPDDRLPCKNGLRAPPFLG